MATSAGVIPYDESGFYLAAMSHRGQRVLADFGGKVEPGDRDVAHAARRELHEEGGLRLATLDGPSLLVNRGRHQLYLQRTDAAPFVTGDKAVREVVKCAWDAWPTLALHPRLKYDEGGRIRKAVAAVGREATERPTRGREPTVTRCAAQS